VEIAVNVGDLIVLGEITGCIQCGRCTSGCPVSLRSPLNVRKLVGQALLPLSHSKLAVEEGELWDCTTCSTCSDRCPKGVRPMDVVIGLRGAVVERGKVQASLRDALESVFQHGNPWGRIRQKRCDWIGETTVPRCNGSIPPSAWLYFVGCTPAYDPRIQQVARALVHLFQAGRLDFCILGEKESCCGNEVRRLGEEGLYDILIEDNTKLFVEHEVNRIITISPHCFNAFKNEYGLDHVQVIHYTQILAQLIEQNRLVMGSTSERTVVYHDPCFLGKQNQVYEEPRQILRAIPGLHLLEFDRCRERALCCEGGGGRMWTEGAGEGERLAVQRVNEAVSMGAQVLATACPFCLLTMEDAVKTAGHEERLVVMDIAELAFEALNLPGSR
jgi:Fe-S oxidoreductase